jgi:hypothetical protein
VIHPQNLPGAVYNADSVTDLLKEKNGVASMQIFSGLR